MKKINYIVLIGLFFHVIIASAAWPSDPTANLLICDGFQISDNSQICTTSDGGYIIIWMDSRNSNYDIFAQKVNSTGSVQWTANGVAICTNGNNQVYPMLVSDGAGGAIITWEDFRSNSSYDIYAQRINSTGTVQWTADGVLISSAANNQENPMIVNDGSGGAIISWKDSRSDANDIYAQKINSNGAVQWTSDGVAICQASDEQTDQKIISDGSGGAIIVWKDVRSGTSTDIYTQKINSSGSVQWTANGVPICTLPSYAYVPELVSDASGGAIITWYDLRNGDPDVYAQKINSGGTVQWTSDGESICEAANSQFIPQLISDGSAGAIISWSDARNGDIDVYVQKINSSGIVQWAANGVAIVLADQYQSNQKIISDGSNGAIICWNDFRNGSHYDIYAQKINSSGAVQWAVNGNVVSSASSQQTYPVMVVDGNGGAVIVWKDSRSMFSDDVYSQNLNYDGTIGPAVPFLTTTSITNITNISATSGGNISYDGGESVTERGVCWNTSSNPTTANSHTSDGTGIGTFVSSLTGLTGNYTLYHVRAYATNSVGTAYGSDVTFTTVPTLPEWGLIILITLSAGFGGLWVFKKFV